jgi:indolepyruvate ferredoxin oxidoreductase
MFEAMGYKLQLPPRAAHDCQANAKGELQAEVRPLDAHRLQADGQAQGPARHAAFDIFGRTEERKTERALIGEYRASIEEVISGLHAENHALALEIAALPEQIQAATAT